MPDEPDHKLASPSALIHCWLSLCDTSELVLGSIIVVCLVPPSWKMDVYLVAVMMSLVVTNFVLSSDFSGYIIVTDLRHVKVLVTLTPFSRSF